MGQFGPPPPYFDRRLLVDSYLNSGFLGGYGAGIGGVH